MDPHDPILFHHARVDGLLGTPLVEILLDHPTQQLAPFGLHHNLQFTVGYPLGCLMRELTEQLFKVRWGSA